MSQNDALLNLLLPENNKICAFYCYCFDYFYFIFLQALYFQYYNLDKFLF